MGTETTLSAERRRTLAIDLTTLGLRQGIPALLAKAGPPLSTFAEWHDTLEKLSANVQRLLAFAEAQGCVEALEAAIRGEKPQAAPPAARVPDPAFDPLLDLSLGPVRAPVADPAPIVVPPGSPQPRPGPAVPGPLPGAFPAPGEATAIALKRAEDVVVTQAIKDEFTAALKGFTDDPEDLKQRARRALGNSVVTDRVAWQKSIEEAVLQLVDEAESEGTLWRLVRGIYEQKPTNSAVRTFVRTRFGMLYQDPVERRTAVKWAVSDSIFDALMVARRTPLIDRSPVRKALSELFTNPDNAATVLTIDGPSKAGKSYLASLIEFLVDTGSRGHPETKPHTDGEYRYALLRPVQQGSLYSVSDVAKDLFSQLGWKSALPQQHKSDDGWAQEVIYEFRNQLALTDDVVWIVADRYWDFPQAKPIVDFLVGMVREATLMAGRKKLRLILIDFPRKPIDNFIEENGGVEAQFEYLNLDWLAPKDVQAFCDAFAGALKGNGAVQASKLFEAIEARVDKTQTGAKLQLSWCAALKQEIAPYW